MSCTYFPLQHVAQMAPEQEGRLVEDQRRREEAGLSRKSTSALERQRKRAEDRKGRERIKIKATVHKKGKSEQA